MSNEIILRAVKAFGFSKKKELADILGISQQNFTNKAGRGTALKSIELEALKRKVNFEWIITGEGEMVSAEPDKPASTIPGIYETQAPYPDPVLSMLATLLKKCDKIECEMAELRKRVEAVEKPAPEAEQEQKQQAGQAPATALEAIGSGGK